MLKLTSSERAKIRNSLCCLAAVLLFGEENKGSGDGNKGCLGGSFVLEDNKLNNKGPREGMGVGVIENCIHEIKM